MNLNIFKGLMIPFLGTTLGSLMVFFMKKQLNETIEKILTGFAAGVMVAASIFSLLLPSLDQSSNLATLAFLPASLGFALGMLGLLGLDLITPHIHLDQSQEGPKSSLSNTTMMVLAVVIHNIPEGMAIGVVYAASLNNNAFSYSSALALAIGIAIQNFPEGAIISMPLHSKGISKTKSAIYGILSGAVEPIAAYITIVFSKYLINLMPYLLAFAAGAMIYVVVEELIPEMSSGKHNNYATIFFMIGFVIMMILDVSLG